MASKVFEQLLCHREETLLSERLEQLEQLEFNPDEKIVYKGTYALPIHHVIYDLCARGMREVDLEELYLEQVLLWLASITTPTKEVVENFLWLGKKAMRALDELMKRYEGVKMTYNAMSLEYMEVLLGYSAVDVEDMVSVLVRSGWEKIYLTEKVILRYTTRRDFSYPSVMKQVSELIRYGSPEPRREVILDILFKMDCDLEWSLARLDEILEVK